MKLDIFNHIFPKRYYERMLQVAPNGKDMHKRVREIPCIVDLAERFRIMDLFDDYAQVICLGSPPIEVFGPPPLSTELAQLANDGMAELVARHPQRFPAFVASLPMNDPQGLLAEAERAVRELGAVGVQVFSNVLGKPLTAPETLPLFDLMAELDLPLWLHPARGANFPDYQQEKKSHYEIWWTFGWPYETSVAMAHIVFEGLFDRHPELKIITHHMGGMIPYFEGRVGPGWDQLGARTSDVDYSLLLRKLAKRPIDYFRLFYADTALFGATEATRCGLRFFGPERVLFASDSPFDPEKGSLYTRTTIEIIDRLDVTPAQRHAIYEGNARRLLKLA
ncbi:MAG TPA: amidohydrolase family protein [Casimicrobiaceae bacterium]|jgi:aminocarboxymuconate-semialdehyde decarboxylase|nr:amidohydrolase family protein [Casimicrobiaceae bacterium]